MYECKICNKKIKSSNGFGNHIKQFHKMETKLYYDNYIKSVKEGFCIECGKEASFYNINKGYRNHCSKSCSKKKQPNAVGWAYVNKPGYIPWNKGKKMSEEYKRNWLKGVKKSKVWGKSPSDETRRKLRLKMIERLNKINKKFHPPYNSAGCKYFEYLMEKEEIFIQHAENGGEFHIKELGYYVDGYDIKNNTVYEWDENSRHHFKEGKLIEKDIIRQKEITEFLGCKFIRIKEQI